MREFHPSSSTEQRVAHLGGEMLEGDLRGTIPGGVSRLVEKLGVGTKTVHAAMGKLEREGFLEWVIPHGRTLGGGYTQRA